MDTKQAVVALAVIERGDTVLLAQRVSQSTFEPNKWGFPGGKVEFGEHPEEAMVREVKEEIGVDVVVEKLLCVNSFTYTTTRSLHTILLFYKVRIVAGEPEALVEQAIEWVAKDKVTTYDLVEGNKTVIDVCLAG